MQNPRKDDDKSPSRNCYSRLFKGNGEMVTTTMEIDDLFTMSPLNTSLFIYALLH
jgi:hypothetical protein